MLQVMFQSFPTQRHTEKAIYKTRNTGTGNGMRGMLGTRGMFTRIPGKYSYFNIPENVPENSGEC